ncbi:cytochrome C [Thermocrinis ruber]|uniref:Cytochrome C n=2 Tax=Thermocrinis ruber TaxID=75906 RepID=W0DCL4_9AQUI|nr:cytochrome C [Thermocrinis ruber]
MKKTLLLGLFTLGFLAVSCQQKPAQQPAGEQKPAEQQQPAGEQQQQQQQQQPAGEQQQPAQQPAGEQKPAEKPKSEAKPAQTTAMAGAEDLAKAKGCFACHDINAKKVGPAFKDVAKRFAGRPDAVAHLSERIKKGGVGEWGNVPMPPQNVTDEEAKKLAEWVLSLK